MNYFLLLVTLLTYLLVRENEDACKQAWDNCRNAEAWQSLRQLDKYAGTVSNITRCFLTALPCSQIK